ncbi:dynamin family protein [Effusibacillus pohliae]|uniref:dynamin family protein n=1 Tax=Effusibacillus pohliae TaxID=232270 RepID=UPI00035F8AC5|nr:dynamin family protein [Effusibacillus pohliae]
MGVQHLGDKLKQLETVFAQAGDRENARKLRQLADKYEQDRFVIAFCGHFSAGKSSMINRLLGSRVLPSSPIPTSANVVTIENGPSRARVWRRDGSYFDVPLADLSKLQEYAADGEVIETIRVQHPAGFLPDRVQLMDTPGIDSTDDAHRVATESALHLADIVLYVMDYNHVLSEVNFRFTKTLKDSGKPVWLVVNQIDKHNELELPFYVYQRSVGESFAAWGIEPDGIFFTTLKDSGHPYNQLGALQDALRSLLGHREPLHRRSIVQSALQLIEDHVQLESAKKEPEKQGYLAVLAEAEAAGIEAGIDALRERVVQLNKQAAQSESVAAELKAEMERELQTLIENAILTPYQTTELAGRYLESRKPGFRVGLLFAGSKTESERQRRLQELHTDFMGKVSANLDWHVKDLLVKIPERYGIRDEQYANSVYGLQLEITQQMLAGWVKEGALASREYMYQYAKDLAAEVKSMYRRAAADCIERAAKLAEADASERARELKNKLEAATRYLRAAEGLEQLKRRQAEYRSALRLLLEEERRAAVTAAASAHPVAVAAVKAGPGPMHPIASEALQTATHQVAEPAAQLAAAVEAGMEQQPGNFKASLVQAAAKLRQAAGETATIPGLQTIAAHMLARAERLERSLFTVALFGAFSAGKSSFANAMMGDLVLPVSPNPTTATINKILPPTVDWPHGSVRVKIKSLSDIAADIKGSLQLLGHQIVLPEPQGDALEDDVEDDGQPFFAEALQRISALDPVGVPPQAKPHVSFLKAVEQGWSGIRDRLGQELRVDMQQFRDFVAREEKACFVEWIELYYDCPLTRNGILLIDTPGADSINARHTKVAFEYIKNADAILFVTYYNHAFSNADREFLIQLGRVKDAFEMDKMFFLVNAADLAADEEELAGVVSHVRNNLIACGISMPRIYPVSSQLALLARLAEKGALPPSADRFYRKLTGTPEGASLPQPAEAVERSGIRSFETDFAAFTIEELTAVAVQAAEADIRRAAAGLREFIDTAQADASVRLEKREALRQALQQVERAVQEVQTESESRSIEQEIDELIYYVKQRVFLCYYDAFNERFSSSVLRDDAKDVKQLLAGCLEELIRFLAFDLGQEMRATAVRVENQVNRAGGRIFDQLAETVQKHMPGCQLQPYRKRSFPVPEFPDTLPGAELNRFAGALSLYKNAKDFFERDQKTKMRGEIEKLLQEPVAAYLAEAERILKTVYLDAFRQVVGELRQDVTKETNEFAAGLLAALSMQMDIEAMQRAEQRLHHLL